MLKDWRLCIRLHRLLSQRYESRKSLTDPAVLAASRQLDRVVVRMMRSRAKTRDAIASDSELHGTADERLGGGQADV